MAVENNVSGSITGQYGELAFLNLSFYALYIWPENGDFSKDNKIYVPENIAMLVQEK